MGKNTERNKFSYPVEEFQSKLDSVLKSFLADKFGATKYFTKRECHLVILKEYTLSICDSKGTEKKELVKEIQSFLIDVFRDQIKEVIVDPYSRLSVKLNKIPFYLAVLHQVSFLKDEYGMNTNGQNRNIFLMFHSYNPNSLVDLRTHLLTQHVALILSINGYKVHIPKNVALNPSIYSANISVYDPQENYDFDVAFQDFLQSIRKSKWFVKYENDLTERNIALNCKEYMFENRIFKKNYDNVDYLFFKKNDLFTKCMQDSVRMHYAIKKFGKKADVVIHLVPVPKDLLIEEAGFLVEMLNSEGIPRHSYLINAGLHNQDNLVDISTYFENKRNESKEAIIHKYGLSALEDEKWQSSLELVVNSEVTFDFLSTKLTCPTKVNLKNFTKGELIRKKGAPVQYSCARLYALFDRFEAQILKQYYDPLPDIDKIDFSELDTSEWNLFFKYVYPFPDVIQKLIENFSVENGDISNIHTHEIIKMLQSLSRDLSFYYSKIRVLLIPGLKNTMFARIYLLRGINQVLKTSLALLNLSPATLM